MKGGNGRLMKGIRRHAMADMSEKARTGQKK